MESKRVQAYFAKGWDAPRMDAQRLADHHRHTDPRNQPRLPQVALRGDDAGAAPALQVQQTLLAGRPSMR
jgi:hypothetical protein